MNLNIASRHHVAEQMFQNFLQGEFPATILVSGPQNQFKEFAIFNVIARALAKANFSGQGKELILQLMRETEYPDFYFFEDSNIAIGEAKKPKQGTIRHLLNKVLPYSPRNGKSRFVYFQNAAMIRDEAESALLKTLEEPREDTHFILSVESADSLKETILSRSIHVPYVRVYDASKVSPDPWQRFWYLSGLGEEAIFNKIKDKGLDQKLKEAYDQINFEARDYLVFEDLTLNFVKEFKKETLDTQFQILRLCLNPLYASIRDALYEGQTATVGPIRIHGYSNEALVKMARAIESVYQVSKTRYFGTRPPNYNATVFNFLGQLMPLWMSKDS